LVTLATGANRQAISDDIAHWLYLDVYTSDQESKLLLQGRLMRMTTILELFRSLLLVVSIVVIALLVYVLTMEKIKSIAALKLLGAQNIVIVRLIMEQSLVLATGSFVIGYALVISTQDRFPRTLVLLMSDTSITFAVLLIGSVLASVFGIWRALRTSPSVALEG
jgi:putative ABC transport system permease protein